MTSRLLLFCFLIPFSVDAFAQQKDKPKENAVTPRPLKVSDAATWQRVRQLKISPTGKWCAHFLMPTEGDGKLIIKQLDATSENGNAGKAAKANSKDSKKSKSASSYEFVVGPNSGSVDFSHDAKFAAYIQAPLDKVAKAAKKSGTPAKQKVVILNLETGDKTEVDNVMRFAFSSDNPDFLALHKMKPKGRPSGDKGWDGSDLVLHNLKKKTQINIGNVKSFAFNKPGKLLAMIIDAEDKSGNGLQLFHVADSKVEPLENGKARYQSLSWTRDGDALSLLKSTQDEKFENPHFQLLAFSDVGGPKQQKILLDPKNQSAIPDDMTISPNRSPEWSDARDLIVFGIHDLKAKPEKKKPEEGGKKSTGPADDGEQAGLVIWHWQDKRLQSKQQKQESRDKNRYDLCVFQVTEKKALRLADEEIPNVSVSRPHRFAVGTNNKKYERFGNMEGSRFQDVYSIELKTGKRKLVLEKAQYVFDVGPNGTSLLYYKNEGHYFIYDMVKGTHTNITQKVKTSFVNTDDDHNVKNPPRRRLGWSADGKFVLLRDGWDIWKVSIDGKSAVNLTVDGKKKQIRYSSPSRFDPEVLGVDLNKPVYITAYGEWTKKAGFGRLNKGKAGVEMLVWEDASFGGLSKLKDHEIYTFSRSTRQDSTDYYVGGPNLKDPRQLTHSNPQQKNFKWTDGVRLVNYKSSKGVKLQGALHLPADYIEGKKYPTIVYMYEKLSQNANRYDSPRTGGFSAAIYTSNGYAVFNPDIVFQINDPGMSSLDCISAGLDAAIKTGVVDPDRVGLHGHSWGGYQTAFLITQTHRFKAAVAGAPLTNMISMYSSIYWNSGSPNQPIFERSQGRFRGGYWDNLEAYARNSPVYYADKVKTPLLLLHNDQDGAVDWNQGIEYFNTLRRLDKPVVMLQYKGENHGLRKPANRKDYSHRMLDFFNHYLKGHDAPKWWSEGIKHLKMKDHIKDYKKSKASAEK